MENCCWRAKSCSEATFSIHILFFFFLNSKPSYNFIILGQGPQTWPFLCSRHAFSISGNL